MATETSKHLLVAAFDFGTTYSGYAFSFRDEPLKVQTNQGWNAGSEKLISLKTPTCVLLNKDKKFHSFGFEAENRYASLAEDGEHEGWLLFRRFKMILHNNEKLSRKTTIEDINGVSMPAMCVFTMVIRYLKDHLLKALNNQTIGIEEADIKYILTVPAIWNDNAKQFMREAAVEAGMEESRLKLCLEPEAASIWCQIVPTSTTDTKDELSKAGTQYMVVDMGGGTADISVHEKQIDGSLKELHKASGGPWGGNAVDTNYFEWLGKIFGKRTMDRYRIEQMSDYFDLFREFETKKRNFTAKTEGKITFRVSASLKDIYKEECGVPLKDKVADLGLSDKVTFVGDKLRIDASIIKTFFDIPVGNTIKHVKEILAEQRMERVSVILLVGGFAESQFVKDELREKIQNKRVITPTETGLVVLKGAVRFGHNTKAITSRVMPFSYGIGFRETFDEKKHPVSRKISVGGVDKVEDVFAVYVRAGEEIKLGQEFTSRKKLASDPTKNTSIQIFRSTNKDPKFVTDDDCKKLGKVLVNASEAKDLKDKHINITLCFGDTELLVKVKILENGKEITKYIDTL